MQCADCKLNNGIYRSVSILYEIKLKFLIMIIKEHQDPLYILMINDEGRDNIVDGLEADHVRCTCARDFLAEII